MLKQKMSNTGGYMPPVSPSSGAAIGFVAADAAANEAQFKRAESHDRRQRRQRRAERQRTRATHRWSVSLW